MTDQTMKGRARWLGARYAAGALMAFALAGCCPAGYVPPAPPRMTLTTPTADNVLTYARLLEYDTTGLVGDKQRLSDVSGNNTGPVIEIYPMLGGHNLDSSDLDAGRVIARLVVKAAGTSGPYFRIGAPPDTAYWWVQGGKQYFVKTTDTGALPPSQALHYDRHAPHNIVDGPTWRRSVARWKWSATDEQAWVSCTKMGCCYADPI